VISKVKNKLTRKSMTLTFMFYSQTLSPIMVSKQTEWKEH